MGGAISIWGSELVKYGPKPNIKTKLNSWHN